MILKFNLNVHICSFLIGLYVFLMTVYIDHYKFVNFLKLMNNFTMGWPKICYDTKVMVKKVIVESN